MISMTLGFVGEVFGPLVIGSAAVIVGGVGGLMLAGRRRWRTRGDLNQTSLSWLSGE